jgi:flagellin-specific chaperone FliS
MYKQLIRANTLKDESILKEILSFVMELKGTWQQACQKVKRGVQP